ncbi:MAG: hypothetical protein LKE64_09130 [Solobacterium sp.]|jgi:hypothetical protein|nr:hypothetical protein [Solobacterium sp.]MCH4014370.1 hypothetical protein [Solobacterium sp.]MCH4014473.1 hypothetical protein [Solobacterium sp.]MCH4048610.1 hypothetical protein [Solobacterium sp.]MCH4048713.1 hypothetical protein [Solobacterium sp.]
MVIAYRTHSDMFKEDWCGEIEFLHLTDPYKMVVHARGNRFDIIFGKGINGSYICIPNWQIGTEIASLKDRFWNRESIRRADDEISDTDIDSVVDALVAAGEYLADHGYN